MGAVETTNISCGRGTDRPFEMYGAPYFDKEELAAEMNSRDIPGIHFVPHTFVPTAKWHDFRGETCHGIYAVVYDREAFNSVIAGMHMAQAMHENAPEDFQDQGGFKTSFGDPKAWDLLINQKKSPEEVLAQFQDRFDNFMKLREKYLLY